MEAESLEQTIKTYKAQLDQVTQALEVNGDNHADLLELRDNLLEVIELTNESLASLANASSVAQGNTTSTAEDDEYAAFQAALAGELTSGQPTTSTADLPDDDPETVLSSNLDDIIGTCVRAPHSHHWGGYQYYNAAIIGFNAETEQVKVMYCQPTHISMKICPYFLRGQCKFSESDCKLSHGHLIDIDELREYEEPDTSKLSVGDTCIAKFPEDDLWYKATIVDTHGEDFLQVMYDDYGETTHAVEKCDVIPSDNQSDISSSEDEDTPTQEDDVTTQDEDELPSYLWQPSESEHLAEWETHTRGVGSKLMALMGYKAGQGLGKDSQGRVEPVPILKLPPGRSLDKIMELKARTGNKDMFDIMKKGKHKGKHKATALRPKKTADMFAYLNKSLGHGKKVDMTSYRKQKTGANAPSVISKHQLTKKSDKNINIQVIKTEEELLRVEREIVSIKQRLEVNVSRRDVGGTNHLTDKLRKAEKYLETLSRSHKELHRHKGQREGRKKLMVF